ncbi:MAG TPA: DoxX family protein [Sphingomicrobium sp.]|jgi:putative oxidoreductase|nr:DoxX family protein [Sphingomicrobium sp.]
MKIEAAYRRFIDLLQGRLVESLVLLFMRIAFAGIFWRSGQTKVVDGTWFQIKPETYDLFSTDFSGVPLQPHLAANLSNAAEHIFPLLLVLGLATRFSATALLIMTMVIQIFVFPDAWWPTHSLWVAMALVLITRGAGLFSIDALLGRRFDTKSASRVARA